METKAAKFQRLIQHRLDNVTDALRILGNLGNRSNYEYTDEQVGHIFAAVDLAVADAREKYGRKAAPVADPVVFTPERKAEVAKLVEFAPEHIAQDPAFPLLLWKDDPTTLPYDKWAAQQRAEMDKVIPGFLRRKA